MTRRLVRSAAGALALCALATPLTLGAAAPPGVRPALCIPLIWCPDPAPTPSPTPTPTKTADPLLPLPGVETPAPEDKAPTAPEDEKDAAEPVEPVQAVPDDAAPVFTGTPAQMSSDGLSFTGLKDISIVTVPTVGGERVRVLKISADSITITGFALSVRPHGGPGLVTDADTMTLRGNVSVYLGSITASDSQGHALTLGIDTPPSLDDVEPGLLHVNMGLVGTIADSIAYTNTDQRMVAAKK